MTLKLKPSARINRRYLFIEGSKEDIEKVILDYIGILGWAKASPFFIKDDANKEDSGNYTTFIENSDKASNQINRNIHKTILAIDRKSISDVRAAFELCKENIKILGVSGTLKGLKKNNLNT